MKDSDWRERTELLLGKTHLEKLKAAHVLIVGLGGVGGYAAEMLCRAGIGNMTIIDADTVHPSNINRQIQALHSTVGQFKSDLLEGRLKDINPRINIISKKIFLKDELIEELLDHNKFDFIADAIDSISPKVFLIHHALSRKIPIISALGAGGKTDLSKIEITDISKTYQCGLAKVIRKRLKNLGIEKGLPVVFSPEAVNKHALILLENEQNKISSLGTVSYYPAVFGCYIAEYIIKKLDYLCPHV